MAGICFDAQLAEFIGSGSDFYGHILQLQHGLPLQCRSARLRFVGPVGP